MHVLNALVRGVSYVSSQEVWLGVDPFHYIHFPEALDSF